MSEATTGATEFKKTVYSYNSEPATAVATNTCLMTPRKVETGRWTTILEKLQTTKMSHSSVPYGYRCKNTQNEILANQTY